MTVLIDESFEGTGYEESWSENLGSGTLDEDNTEVARPTGGGAQVLKLVKTSPDYDTYTQRDVGSEQAVSYTRFWFRYASEGFSTYNYATLVRCRNEENTTPIRVLLRQNESDDIEFRLYLYNNGGDHWYSSDNTLSVDTWYKVEFKYDTTGETWEWKVGGVVQDSGSLTGTYRDGPRYWRLGMNEGYALTCYFDLVAVDTSGYPADPVVGAAVPVLSKDGVHLLVFGGQVISG